MLTKTQLFKTSLFSIQPHFNQILEKIILCQNHSLNTDSLITRLGCSTPTPHSKMHYTPEHNAPTRIKNKANGTIKDRVPLNLADATAVRSTFNTCKTVLHIDPKRKKKKKLNNHNNKHNSKKYNQHATLAYLSGDELSTQLQIMFKMSVNSGTFLPPSNPGSPSK